MACDLDSCGIETALEDKNVQQAVMTILNQIYEVDFKGFVWAAARLKRSMRS